MSSANPAVLIVEDEPQMRRFLRHALESHGYQVVEAANARLGLAQAAGRNPDLILLDLHMPGLDGFGVLEGLKEVEPDRPLSVLAMTSHPGNKERARQAGAKDFIGKPFKALEVLTRVYNLLELRLLQSRTGISAPPGQ